MIATVMPAPIAHRTVPVSSACPPGTPMCAAYQPARTEAIVVEVSPAASTATAVVGELLWSIIAR